MKILTAILILSQLLAMASNSSAMEFQSPLSDWNNLKTIASGQEIQIALKTKKTLTGYFGSVSDGEVEVTVNGGKELIKRESVQQVFLITKGRSQRSLLIGSVVGAGIGLAGVAAVGATNDSEGVSGATYALPAIGAGIGALVGSLFSKRSKKKLIFQVR